MSKEKSEGGWIGIDLDGTLAFYDGWKGICHIGDPVPKMLERVKEWISQGRKMKIFTARIAPTSLAMNNISLIDVLDPIEKWCLKHLGVLLQVTHEKDFGMIELWDDRAIQIIPNTGLRADGRE